MLDSITRSAFENGSLGLFQEVLTAHNTLCPAGLSKYRACLTVESWLLVFGGDMEALLRVGMNPFNIPNYNLVQKSICICILSNCSQAHTHIVLCLWGVLQWLESLLMIVTIIVDIKFLSSLGYLTCTPLVLYALKPFTTSNVFTNSDLTISI